MEELDKQKISKLSVMKKRAPKTTYAVLISKRKKKGNNPSDDSFVSYISEFKAKLSPYFTTADDLVLCKAYAFVFCTIGAECTVEKILV